MVTQRLSPPWSGVTSVIWNGSASASSVTGVLLRGAERPCDQHVVVAGLGRRHQRGLVGRERVFARTQSNAKPLGTSP